MPLTLPDNQAVAYYISAVDDHGLDGATLGSGQTDTVTSSDPATVVLTPDATPKPAPDGSASIASGMASPASPVAAPNKPITITSHIANADGTPGTDDNGNVINDATDTVTIAPGQAKSAGVLFGVPAAQTPTVPVPPATGAAGASARRA